MKPNEITIALCCVLLALICFTAGFVVNDAYGQEYCYTYGNSTTCKGGPDGDTHTYRFGNSSITNQTDSFYDYLRDEEE